MKLGMIVRCDRSGLGYQTRALAYMLKPDKVLIIDSTPFNGNEQHFEWYDGFDSDKVYGFMTKQQAMLWMKDLTHILTAESFYNDYFINLAMRKGIKTYNIPNYEFMDHMVRPMTPPTKFIMPSHWMYEQVKAKYLSTIQLNQPLFPNDFKEARETNFGRTGKRFLHIVGNYASKDRNGTKSLIEALEHTNKDFELVIRTQKDLDFYTDDSRVTTESRNIEDQQELYKDFDAMILPRRYGGLCLPANEALMSGLPVIMTGISPNNRVLPEEWLVPAKVIDKLYTRMVLDVYGADPQDLAKKIDWLCETDLSPQKARAFELGMNYAADNLRDKYKEAMV